MPQAYHREVGHASANPRLCALVNARSSFRTRVVLVADARHVDVSAARTVTEQSEPGSLSESGLKSDLLARIEPGFSIETVQQTGDTLAVIPSKPQRSAGASPCSDPAAVRRPLRSDPVEFHSAEER